MEVFILFLINQFHLADSLFRNSLFDIAELEYKRLLFLDTTLKQNKDLRLNYTIAKIHHCPLDGLSEVERLFNDFPDIDDSSKVAIARALGEKKFYYSAIKILSQTNEKRLLGYYYLLDNQPLQARAIFLEQNDSNLVVEIDRFLRKRKSVIRATVYSMIFPGAGEFYAGDIKLAIFDFILTWGSGYLVYDAIKDKRYVDAGLIFGFLFNRFYFGSISDARRLAEKTQELTPEQKEKLSLNLNSQP